MNSVLHKIDANACIDVSHRYKIHLFPLNSAFVPHPNLEEKNWEQKDGSGYEREMIWMC
jgi:hypothetical protein